MDDANMLQLGAQVLSCDMTRSVRDEFRPFEQDTAKGEVQDITCELVALVRRFDRTRWIYQSHRFRAEAWLRKCGFAPPPQCSTTHGQDGGGAHLRRAAPGAELHELGKFCLHFYRLMPNFMDHFSCSHVKDSHSSRADTSNHPHQTGQDLKPGARKTDDENTSIMYHPSVRCTWRTSQNSNHGGQNDYQPGLVYLHQEFSHCITGFRQQTPKF